jgi:hypothetical protein
MEAFFCREDRKLQVRCLSNHSYLTEKHTQSLQRNISTHFRIKLIYVLLQRQSLNLH